MKTKSILGNFGIALVGAMMIMASAAFAQGKPDKADRMARRGEMKDKLIQKLNITADQQAKLKALRDQFKAQNSGSMSEIKALREKMQEYAKNHDEANLKATRDQLKAKMEAMKPAREQLRAQMKAILTPDQQAQLEKLKADRKAKMQDRKEKWQEKRKDRLEKGGANGDDNLN
ncbi:MAG: Periplasmic repressor CpxP [Chlorobi bacterium]|nr:Periplasmic repressor CpxP [Chlorobiota bacterium]